MSSSELTELRRAAMDLLARREHSRAELTEKVQRRFSESATDLESVLDQLELDGLLSDERFAIAYVRYRRTRGAGPLLVRQELRGKGIEAALLEAVVDVRAEEWLDTLRELIGKKTRLLSHSAQSLPLKPDSLPHTNAQEARKQRQKLFRFCLSRGFTSDQIDRVSR